jgi:hypothetical protein
MPAPRDIVTVLFTLVRGLAWFVACSLVVFDLAYLFTNLSRMNRFGMPKSAEFGSWVVMAIVALIAAFLLHRSRKKVSDWIASRQSERIREIEVPPVEETRVLCIWAKGDEIMCVFRWLDRMVSLSSFWLRPMPATVVFVLIFVWLVPAGGDAIYRILHLFGDAFFSLVVWSILPFALLVDFVARSLGINVSSFQLLGVAVIALATLVLLVIGTWLVAACLHVVLKLLPFGMAGWRFFDTIFLRISSSPVSPNSRTVTAEEVSIPRTGWLHSSVYRNDEALQKMVAFIRG